MGAGEDLGERVGRREERFSSHSAEYTDFGDEKQTERGISSHLADLCRSSLNCIV